MTVNGGSQVTSGTSFIGLEATGTATITDNGSSWDMSTLYVGRSGTGNLIVSNGGAVSSDGPIVSIGTISVTGDGSMVTSSSFEMNGGTLNVSGGGKLVNMFAQINVGSNNNSATISGVGSSWTLNNYLSLGENVDGNNITIQNGATLSTGTAYIGGLTSASVTVTGANTTWTNSADLTITQLGSGTLNASQGGTVVVGGETIVGHTSSATGTINFDGGTLNTGGLLTRIGDLQGTGIINTHGLVTDVDLTINQTTGVQQQFIMSGSGQNITVNLDANSAGSLGAGYGGQGSLTISDGVAVNSKNGYLGYLTGSSGVATVDGPGTSWTINGNLEIGNRGTASITIKNAAAVDVGQTTSTSVFAASSINLDSGTLTTKSLLASPTQINGTGTINANGLVSNLALVFDHTHPLQQQIILANQSNQNVVVNLNVDGTATMGAGYLGQGSLTVADGIVLNSTTGTLGVGAGSVGTATVSGFGSTWSVGGQLTMGDYVAGATGNLTISNGAEIDDTDGLISKGKVTVTGSGSTWNNRANLALDGVGAPTLPEIVVSAGGKMASTSTADGSTASGIGVGAGHAGKVTVDGLGSSWTHSGTLEVGSSGTGTLIVSNGGSVVSSAGVVGNSSFASGTVTVGGTGSSWTTAGALTIGNNGTGSLTISAGGSVSSQSGAIAAGNSLHTGTVSVSGQAAIWNIANGLTLGETTTFGGAATLTIGTSGLVTVGGGTTIFGEGKINLQGGTLATSSISFQNTGGVFNWTSGTLHVGTYNGSLTNSSGILAPGQSIGETTITGSYTQRSSASLQIEIGGTAGATQYDLLNITSSATLGGSLNVSFLNNFIPNSTDTFTILTAGTSLSGSFSNIANGQRLTTMDGIGSFLISYSSTTKQVVLSEFQAIAIPGDFDHSGAVDVADYLIWRKGLGSTYTQADYGVWRAHFGQSSGSGSGVSMNAAVPEPGTIMLLIVGLMCMTCRRRAAA